MLAYHHDRRTGSVNITAMDERERSTTGSHFVAKDAVALAAEAERSEAPRHHRRHRRRFSEKLRTQHAIRRARVVLAIVVMSAAIVALSFYLGSKSSDFQMDTSRSGRR
jgi:hypothetical protein